MSNLLRALWRTIVIAVCFASFPQLTNAQQYSITEIGAGYTPRGMNNLGDVVGVGPNARGFLWQNGNMFELPTLAGLYGQAMAINDSRQIGGSATDSQGIGRPVIWQDNQVIQLTTLLGQGGRVRGINSNGDAVGQVGVNGVAGAVWINGILLQDFGAPAERVNDFATPG